MDEMVRVFVMGKKSRIPQTTMYEERLSPIISAKGIVHSYDQLPIIDHISLEIKPGESVSLMSPSGAGKSTLLRLVLGLEKPVQGQVSLSLRPNEVGAAFQDDNLLPWLDVAENVCLLNKLHRRPVQLSDLGDVLRVTGLEGFKDYFPWQLSGGMRQKAAVARLLLYKPQLYILDESLANMDDMSRFTLCDILYSQVIEGKSSIFFITHNLVDALHLTNRILIGSDRPLKIINEFRNPLPRGRDYRIRFTSGFQEAMEGLQKCLGQL
jgi:NitT/TauT family transport system ATP-binding protein